MISFASCSLLGDMFSGEVITTEDNVALGHEGEIVYIPLDQVPIEYREQLKASGKRLVVIPKESVKDESVPVIPLDEVSNDSLEGVAGLALDTAKVIWPGIAALEGLGVIFSRRKRKHYATALRAVVPSDGAVDVKSAATSLVRAMGLAHSSEGTKALVEVESGAVPQQKVTTKVV